MELNFNFSTNEASDEDRIMMVKQQVQASVGNFDSLDKFTKMYVAQAMGVKDVAEAQRLLNMSTAEYQKYQQGQKQQADIQKELADATESVVPIMQQLKLASFHRFSGFCSNYSNSPPYTVHFSRYCNVYRVRGALLRHSYSCFAAKVSQGIDCCCVSY